MSTHQKNHVLQQILHTRIVPVFHHPDPEIAKQIVKSCYEGGIRTFEFTNRGDFSHEIFTELNKWIKNHYPDMHLGVGSVVDAATASLYLQLGASFVVSPLLNADISRTCNRRQVAYIPGCGTATEIGHAHELGSEIVKLFPGEVLGPSFIKSLLGPMPWSKVMVTGGVEATRESLESWFEAGACCVGIGSKLFPKEIIAAAEWEKITQTCKQMLEFLKLAEKK